MRRPAQPTPHEELNQFEVRVIVAGTRFYDDYELFSQTLSQYHVRFAGKNVVYISGKARTGADAMVIRWCQEHGLPWAEFPAKWNDFTHPLSKSRTIQKSWGPYTFNVMAGPVRNQEMADVGTHLLTFYDGSSTGTGDMISRMLAKLGKELAEKNVVTVLVDVAKPSSA